MLRMKDGDGVQLDSIVCTSIRLDLRQAEALLRNYVATAQDGLGGSRGNLSKLGLW